MPIWFEALGRYLWKVDRPRQEEVAYWTGRFAKRFGNETAGRQILQWYDTTGPVLPGLQNLTHVHNMNFFPTAVGKEQMVDAILNTAACTRDYPSQPVDTFFFDRYKRKYDMPELTNRITMPIDAYADKLAAGQTVTGAMTPDKVVDLLVEMAEEGCRLAESAEKAATLNQDEAARFVTDSQALVYVAQAWREKVYAAIAKRCYQKTKDEKYAQSLRDHLQRSIEVYEKLVALTDKTYVNASDMAMSLNWHEGLKAFKKDQENQKKFLDYRIMRYKPGTPEQIVAWQNDLRTKLFKLLKLDDLVPNVSQIPFDAKEVKTWEMPGFTVKEMTIQSTPGRRIEIVLTMPKQSEGPLPAVVCIGGHGSNKFSVYTGGKAFGPHPADASDGSPIYKGFASELAKSGYVTISTLRQPARRVRAGAHADGRAAVGSDAMRELSGIVAERRQSPHRLRRAFARRRNDDVAGGDGPAHCGGRQFRLADHDGSARIQSLPMLEIRRPAGTGGLGRRLRHDRPKAARMPERPQGDGLGLPSGACREGDGRDPARV